MKFTIRGKLLGMARRKLHADNLRWGNYVWVNLYFVRLSAQHMNKSIKPAEISVESIEYLGFWPPDKNGVCGGMSKGTYLVDRRR